MPDTAMEVSDMTELGEVQAGTMRPIRIIIADDHAMMCEGLKAMLDPPHAVVRIVHDGRDVLHAIELLEPELVLLDISLPGENGLTILRRLRAERGADGPRVLMLTMHTERAYADEAIAAGADGYLLKSSGAAELRFAVAEAMAGRVYVTPLLRADGEMSGAGEVNRADEKAGGTGRGGRETGAGAARPRAMAATLTERQREVLQLLAAGHSTVEIGARLGITPKTVEFHRHAIRQELGLSSQASLVRFAVAAGLVEA